MRFIMSSRILLCFIFFRCLPFFFYRKIGYSRLHQDIVPRNQFADVGRINPLRIEIGQYFSKISTQNFFIGFRRDRCDSTVFFFLYTIKYLVKGLFPTLRVHGYVSQRGYFIMTVRQRTFSRRQGFNNQCPFRLRDQLKKSRTTRYG